MKLVLIIFALLSFNSWAATHCQTQEGAEWNMSFSVFSDKLKYRITGRDFESPLIVNANKSYIMIEALNDGFFVFIRSLRINGKTGVVNSTSLDPNTSEIITSRKLDLNCVTVPD
ncbi:hypothetical protein [Vibrio atlanticus]|uniref:Uncharacterized protein n=1 Tax=Vibrio atlanticus (strain LGP32) TaxID=575788 RepID=B7VSL1_VIBA3|nr:hypothetical protein [Vibrio atlanticus]CAV26602.1 Hypothetical protein VS_II0828 [Vibrio atlanticus]